MNVVLVVPDALSNDAGGDGERLGSACEEAARRGAGRTSHWCDSWGVCRDMEPSGTRDPSFFTSCVCPGVFLSAPQLAHLSIRLASLSRDITQGADVVTLSRPSRHYHTNGDDQHRRLLINMLQSGTTPKYRHRRQQQISTGHADDSLWVNKFKICRGRKQRRNTNNKTCDNNNSPFRRKTGLRSTYIY